MDAEYNRTKHEPVTYLIGVVYAVKIGRTKNVTWRLSILQAGNPETLAILAVTTIPERELHKRFATARIKREWFRRTPELDHFIASCPANHQALVSLRELVDRETNLPQ